MDNILSIILSSAVVVAIINNVIIVFNHNKDSKLHHITSERSEWRKEIKEIALELHGADSTSISKVLTKLKVRINAYGQYPAGNYPENEDLDFLQDAHIWKLIYNIENSNDEADFQAKKMLLINCLSGLLKFDWERSKEEVKSGKINIVLFICTVLSMACLFATIYLSPIDSSNNSIFNQIILALSVVGLPLFIMTFPFWLDNSKTLRTPKWYKNTHFSAFIFGIVLVCIVIMISAFFKFNNTTAEMLFSIFRTTYIFAAFSCFINNWGKRKLYIDYDKLISKILGIPQNDKIKDRKKQRKHLAAFKRLRGKNNKTLLIDGNPND